MHIRRTNSIAANHVHSLTWVHFSFSFATRRKVRHYKTQLTCMGHFEKQLDSAILNTVNFSAITIDHFQKYIIQFIVLETFPVYCSRHFEWVRKSDGRTRPIKKWRRSIPETFPGQLIRMPYFCTLNTSTAGKMFRARERTAQSLEMSQWWKP